ncbi:symmetrical bis(5'-nucleosyl)-tetraphosphatase [Umboniibacter marinipuniceus]|uniref:bis(5'-nucleosyl)-tetraphosphatase (symmetrical) n=1 Tax=Umboniibacter marinipuniceus TaxID=569599 RepID=A0A3M0A520_9GAMM|nr:symmetrical bis(5'-nucleosyl)-tetraphosphatase [Umboniibacter marinipuniceus]RMA80133.1 bis(5'nucleosyl)-tetraphosphatase ApaH [Umboniibacter marinipuniceus]
MTRWVIGDIQGCFSAFETLLGAINFQPQSDQLYLCGDLINRGEDDLATISWLYHHRDVVFPVLGNHDLHFLATYYSAKPAGSKDTFAKLLSSQHIASYCEWLVQQPLIRLIDDHFILSHAGVPHIWEATKAIDLASEVSCALQTDHGRRTFFASMYGNQPSSWDDALSGSARLRAITNYFTRMRYISAEGELEFRCSDLSGPNDTRFQAWFNWPRKDHYQLLFGHWAALEGNCAVDHIEALDGGCVWGGHLIAYNLDTGERISVQNPISSPVTIRTKS